MVTPDDVELVQDSRQYRFRKAGNKPAASVVMKFPTSRSPGGPPHMKLSKQDQEFRNPKLFYPDPKSVDLDRVLINLFLLLRCNGTRPVTRGRPKAGVERIDYHLDQLAQLDGVSGLNDHLQGGC